MAEFDIAQIDVEATQATTKGRYNSLVMIDSTHFIVAYTDTNGDGMIKTFSVDADGDNITQIAELEHDTTSCTYNSLVMIDSTHFMLAYDYNGDAGRLRTFSIDGNYENITTIDTLNHDTTKGFWNSLVKIDSTHFMLAYMGSSNNYGVVKVNFIEDGESVEFGKIKVTAVGFTGKDSETFSYLFEEGEKKVLYAPCDTISFKREEDFKDLDLLINECGLFSKISGEICFSDLMKRLKNMCPKRTILTHIEEIEVNAFGEEHLQKMKDKHSDVNFDFAHDGMQIQL